MADIEKAERVDGRQIWIGAVGDTEITDGVHAWDILLISNGVVKQFNGVSWDQIGANGDKRFQITPTLAGVGTTEVIADATGSNTILSAIAVFNALDNVTAGDAVKNRFPDVKRIELDEAITIHSDVNITKVWVLAFGTVDNTGGNVIAEATTTGSTIRAALLEFTFAAVDAVKTVEISLGSKKTSGTSVVPSRYATIRVEGSSYA